MNPAPDVEFNVVTYDPSFRDELLRLLIELQSVYLRENISPEIQELQKERNLRRAYESYVQILEADGAKWRTLLAIDGNYRALGFIIGSVEVDEELLLSPIGKVEDWFVEDEFRLKGIGTMLYTELEKWFIERHCRQVRSDTWYGNRLSVEVHKRLGFFTSGIQFGKKL